MKKGWENNIQNLNVNTTPNQRNIQLWSKAFVVESHYINEEAKFCPTLV